VHAFTTFTQAADSLEKSYGQFQIEVARLGGELDRANTELTRSLEENTLVRSFPAQVLEGLPCGVRVFDAAKQLRVFNPEAPLPLARTPIRDPTCRARLSSQCPRHHHVRPGTQDAINLKQ
jgi:nitrogen fixation/metabolism regulation signal transduction histidine kinase